MNHRTQYSDDSGNYRVNEEKLKIAVVGRVPPPPGGVGASIVSIVEVLRQRVDADARHLNWHEMWKLFFFRPHVLHLNFSMPFKSLLGALVGRLAGARIVHTVHGDKFDFGLKSNRAAMVLSHGYILLNERIYGSFKRLGGRCRLALMTPILASTRTESETLPSDDEAVLAEFAGRKIAVAYAHSRDFRCGVETYGFKFVADLLPELDSMGVSVMFLDTMNQYSTNELDPYNVGNMVHVKRGMHFRLLCQRIDIYIRPTATDGNSVAVLEALDVGTPVVASDSVPRPVGVIEYRFGDRANFLLAVEQALNRPRIDKSETQITPRLTTGEQYISFLRSLPLK